MIETFDFPLPPTLNKIIGAARNNRYGSANEKRIWTGKIAALCTGKQNFPGKVWVEFIWRVKNYNADNDNISASSKFIFDGFVLAGILKDDSLKYTMSPILHWYEKGDNTVKVTITDFIMWKINNVTSLGEPR